MSLHNDYSIGNQKIERVYEMRDLGVICDEKLNFMRHIEHITNKAKSMLPLAKRICYGKFGVETAKLLYFSIVRSHLEFASVIWTPYHLNHRNAVESLQNRLLFMQMVIV